MHRTQKAALVLAGVLQSLTHFQTCTEGCKYLNNSTTALAPNIVWMWTLLKLCIVLCAFFMVIYLQAAEACLICLLHSDRKGVKDGNHLTQVRKCWDDQHGKHNSSNIISISACWHLHLRTFPYFNGRIVIHSDKWATLLSGWVAKIGLPVVQQYLHIDMTVDSSRTSYHCLFSVLPSSFLMQSFLLYMTTLYQGLQDSLSGYWTCLSAGQLQQFPTCSEVHTRKKVVPWAHVEHL